MVSLLANANKFAPGGEVTLTVVMTGPEGIEIRVADTGCGIPTDQLERVFKPFHPVEKLNGTGLGLPLSGSWRSRMVGTRERSRALDDRHPRPSRPCGPRRNLERSGSNSLIH
jgi:signal transduction histidine kinase